MSRLREPAGYFSGGNQQRLVLGKWLHRRPGVLLMDEFMRGIDVGAKEEILTVVRQLAAEGMSLIIVSSEFDELIEAADRVLVLARRRLIGEFDQADASVERILRLVFEVDEQTDEPLVHDPPVTPPTARMRMTTPPTSERLIERAGRYRVVLLRTYGIVIAFVILVAVDAALSPQFATRLNIFNLFSQWAPAGIMAVAMTFVILTGGFDLSIASGFSLCAVTAAAVGRTEDPAVAFLAALGVGLAIGFVATVPSSQEPQETRSSRPSGRDSSSAESPSSRPATSPTPSTTLASERSGPGAGTTSLTRG